MTPVKTLTPLPDWLLAPVLRELFAAMGEENAMFVGGAVRKALAGETPDDFDIATKLSPQDVSRALAAKGFQIIPTGIEHGTVTAVKSGYSFEITTLRADIKTDGRHAEVIQIDSWLEDAKRRDFTFNTLLLNARGELFDPLGNGITDLTQGMIRFVGDPVTRIKEDYLRIYRFYRFWAYLGSADFSVDTDVRAALAAGKSGAKNLSKERVTKELSKLLASKHVSAVIAALSHMNETNLLPMPINASLSLDRLARVMVLSSLEARFIALYGVEADFSRPHSPYLFSNKQLKAIESIKSAVKSLAQGIEVTCYLCGKEAASAAAIYLDKAMLLPQIASFSIPEFPLKATNIQAVSPVSGKALGDILRDYEAKWLESGFDNGVLAPYL